MQSSSVWVSRASEQLRQPSFVMQFGRVAIKQLPAAIKEDRPVRDRAGDRPQPADIGYDKGNQYR